MKLACFRSSLQSLYFGRLTRETRLRQGFVGQAAYAPLLSRGINSACAGHTLLRRQNLISKSYSRALPRRFNSGSHVQPIVILDSSCREQPRESARLQPRGRRNDSQSLDPTKILVVKCSYFVTPFQRCRGHDQVIGTDHFTSGALSSRRAACKSRYHARASFADKLLSFKTLAKSLPVQTVG